jgi:hypothetical protein
LHRRWAVGTGSTLAPWYSVVKISERRHQLLMITFVDNILGPVGN